MRNRLRAHGLQAAASHDEAVLLGSHATRQHRATAVVSACRVGRRQPCFGTARVIVEARLINSDDPAANPNLGFVLYDAADAVRGLRSEGHTVLLHCVAAEQRTPSIAVGYSVLLGHDVDGARIAVQGSLPSTRGRSRLWDASDLADLTSMTEEDVALLA